MTSHKEPKPKQKRPWRKPRLYMVDFAVTEQPGCVKTGRAFNEGTPGPFGPACAYDPNVS